MCAPTTHIAHLTVSTNASNLSEYQAKWSNPDAPELSVSIPLEQRLFGQGATGTWKHFTVTTRAD